MKVIHERFKDTDSPSVEGQIRWLQKQGFAQHHLEQAMISVYGDIDNGRVPRVFKKTITENDKQTTETIYRNFGESPPDSRWGEGEEISTGHDLDQVLMIAAKQARTDELSAMIINMEKFTEKLKQKWAEEQKPSLLNRIFSKKKKQ